MEKTLELGMIADGCLPETESHIAEVPIPFGHAVKRGTDPADQVLPWNGAAAADRFVGFAVHSVEGDLDLKLYHLGSNFPVFRKGRIWVRLSPTSAAVVPGDKVAVYDDGLVGKGPIVTADIAASKLLEPAGDNNDILITAKKPGLIGNGIKIALVDPSGNSKSLAVSILNDVISVSLATDAAGDITSTAAEVIAAINSALVVKDLVVAANGPDCDGTGVVTAIAAVALAGGAASAGKYGVNLNTEFKTAANPGDPVVVEINLPSDCPTVQF